MNKKELTFEDIYYEYEGRIYNFIRQMIQNEEEAKDLNQEVFIKVYRSLSTFRGECSLSTWLYRIATNKCYDYFRRQTSAGRDKTLPLEPDLEKVSFVQDKIFDLHQKTVESEMKECIHNFINNLSTNYRTTLILHDMEGLKNREIAAIIGCSLETVKICLHRARKKIKTILDSNCKFSYNEQNLFCCEPKNK